MKTTFLFTTILLMSSTLFSQTFTKLTGASNPMNGFNTGTQGYASPNFIDIDNDGDFDCFSGTKEFGIYFYENTGSNINPTMVQRTGVNNPLNGVSNTFLTPTFVDIDNDDDFDCFIGRGNSAFKYFENQGTKFAPNFVEQFNTNNPLNSMSRQQYNRPTFVDIDDDGDFDAFNAQQNGFIQFYENTGTVASPTFVTRTGTANPFDGVDLGSFSSISFYDIDSDGDYDAFAGENDGRFEFYENTGTKFAPIFTLQAAANNPLNGFDVGQISIAFFVDIDDDSNIDCFLGGRNGNFTFLENTALLPVELAFFEGENTENGNLLTWQTAFEENNDGFYIERSEDGKTWETIDFVQGNGTTLEVSDYDYLDESPFENINYYRLQQVDFDGKFEYSNIVFIEKRTSDSEEVETQLFPNPTHDILNIENGEGEAIIYNLLGQPVQSFKIQNSSFKINISDLPNGQYILHIRKQNGTVSTQRFIKTY